jgi:hypothetical protein
MISVELRFNLREVRRSPDRRILSMRISQKRTCNRCQAYGYWYGRNSSHICSLGYAMREGVPIEPCPKPLKIKDLMRIIESGEFPANVVKQEASNGN